MTSLPTLHTCSLSVHTRVQLLLNRPTTTGVAPAPATAFPRGHPQLRLRWRTAAIAAAGAPAGWEAHSCDSGGGAKNRSPAVAHVILLPGVTTPRKLAER